LDKDFFPDLYKKLENIYLSKDSATIKAIFSHLVHISKCKGLKVQFFIDRIAQLEQILVLKISVKVKEKK